MNQPITNTVSTFIESQLPGFVRDDNPQFAAFLKAYYAWMETSNIAAVVSQSKALPSYKDVDRTLDGFLQYFINDFLPHFPNDTALDKRKLIKLAREFYLKKGSIESIQFLFRVLYNLEADVFLPKENILRASDGKWNLPQALRLIENDQLYPILEGGNTFTYVANNQTDGGDFSSNGTLLVLGSDFADSGVIPHNFDTSLLIGRSGRGTVSNAVCVIESADRVVDLGIGLEIIQVFISNITKPFSDLENLEVIYGTDSNGNDLIFSEKIVASLSDIKINPKQRGLKYRGLTKDGAGLVTYPGDPVVITGGLPAGDAKAQKAVAYVNSATTGSITAVGVDFGGYGYRIQPYTIVTVARGVGDTTGAGGNVAVDGIDLANSFLIPLNTDVITYKKNVTIGSANYGFANLDLCNSNTVLASAFTFVPTQFGPISSMNVINGGGGYSAPPTINTAVVYYSDLDNDLANAADPALANNLNYMHDLGYVCVITIDNGGNGYSNVTDTIVVPSAIGYNLATTFTTDPTTNAITTVTITNRGEGYLQLPTSLVVKNSANTANASAGQHAQLTAWGFGEGADLNVSVNKIGQIIDFRLASRGFDYTSTPNVSLRIQDYIINDPGSNLSFSVDEAIFQGANVSSTTYIANVDSYNVATKTLRIYDYRGTLVTNANLSTLTQNVTINISTNSNVTTYGDGKAKANAIFLNGLINFPGFYYNTDGFLSADKYLQDSEVYHNYSYIINVEKSLKQYKDTLMKLVHPAGMSMLGKYIVKQNKDERANVTAKVAVEPVIHGRVYCNAFDVNKVLVGSGGGNTTMNSVHFIAHSGQTLFNITPVSDNTTYIANESYAMVMRNGLVEIPISHYTTTPNTVTMTVPCRDDDIVEIRIFGGSQNNITLGSDSYFSGVNQTSFAMTSGLNSATSGATFNSRPYVITTKNGLVQVPTLHYDIINANVVFTQNCRFGDYVEIRQFSGNTGPTGNVTISTLHGTIVDNVGNTTFVIADNVGSDLSMILSINGIIQVPELQYTVTDNNVVTLTTPVRANDVYDFRSFLGDVGTGDGTQFLVDAVAGDLVTFGYNDGSRPLMTKIITRVISNTLLNMESNTQHPFVSLMTVNTGSNVISSDNGLIIGNVANLDIVQLNVSGNLISSIVQGDPTNTTLTVNTVFAANATNLVMFVYPSMNAATYKITKTPT